MGNICPETWLYGESHWEHVAEVIVVYMCSDECAAAFFRAGPGCLHTGAEVHPNGWVECSRCGDSTGFCDNNLREDRLGFMHDFNPRGVCTFCGERKEGA